MAGFFKFRSGESVRFVRSQVSYPHFMGRIKFNVVSFVKGMGKIFFKKMSKNKKTIDMICQCVYNTLVLVITDLIAH